MKALPELVFWCPNRQHHTVCVADSIHRPLLLDHINDLLPPLALWFPICIDGKQVRETNASQSLDMRADAKTYERKPGIYSVYDIHKYLVPYSRLYEPHISIYTSNPVLRPLSHVSAPTKRLFALLSGTSTSDMSHFPTATYSSSELGSRQWRYLHWS
jgi:hypothetical protein